MVFDLWIVTDPHSNPISRDPKGPDLSIRGLDLDDLDLMISGS